MRLHLGTTERELESESSQLSRRSPTYAAELHTTVLTLRSTSAQKAAGRDNERYKI